MNEKFFDLKKEKQDRMINAALKVFAAGGYAHASTDEIVKEAGISKGLLFHYFISKLGLYGFIYDYSVRYLMLELSTGVSAQETDYFELLLQIKNSQLQAMRSYPCILRFLNKCRAETAAEALAETQERRGVLPKRYQEIMERADLDKFKKDVDTGAAERMMEFTLDGIMEEHFINGSFQPELYFEEIKRYVDMMKKICYQ
ncbi:MAG: TetR/AcrR family transcriptional regulator [Clostridium sp.]|nr:TetR/AcrR family transcriptional regulator [Clostridium sp.]